MLEIKINSTDLDEITAACECVISEIEAGESITGNWQPITREDGEIFLKENNEPIGEFRGRGESEQDEQGESDNEY